jgi:proline dehydrogenase
MELLHRIDFSNTNIAFAGKSNQELRKSYWMFRLMNAKWLVDTLSLLAPLAIKLRLPIDWAVKATVYQQFCGGETIEGCENAIAELNKYHIGTILDYSVEGKASEAEFDACEAEIIRTIEKARGDHRIPFSVFKVTGVARFELLEKINRHETLTPRELEEWGRIWKRVHNIAKTAQRADQPLLIDAEESWIQGTIDQLVTQLMEEFNKEKPIVYNTIQLYRHDRLAYLKQSYVRAREGNYWYAVKLVRGAYMEKERARAQELDYPSPIQPNKAASDRDFNEALKFCVEHIENLALCSGSHNERSNLYLVELMIQHQLPPYHRHIWFAQLKGMSDHISYNLAFAGYNVCKYLPYAPVRAMLPYLIRRAQENTSIAGQMSRELSLILRERKRREQQSA